MTALGDARIQFYLRHRAQIEEWVSLRSEAADEVNLLLVSLGDDIEVLAESLDSSILLDRFVEDPWPRFMLRRSGWPTEGKDSTVSVTFEWPRGALLSGAGQDRRPYVGVRLDRSHDLAESIRRGFDEYVGSQLQSLGYPDRPSASWPAWKRVEATYDYWTDTEPYRRLVLDEVRETWTTFERYIEAAISGVRAGPR